MSTDFSDRGRAAPVTTTARGAAASNGGLAQPTAEARPQIDAKIVLSQNNIIDVGKYFRKLEFKGMVNGGYIVNIILFDSHFNIHTKLIEEGYFNNARIRPVLIKFRLKHGPDSDNPKMTKEQVAILTSLEVTTKDEDAAHLYITAIDPPSYYLSAGTGSTKVYTGRMTDAIESCVESLGNISLTIQPSIDSNSNKWYMLRQDPKNFISSLLEWSSSLSKTKTNWLVASDGFNLTIKDQGSWLSRQRAFYKLMADGGRSTLMNSEIITDHSLSALQTKLVTQGISAISGKVWDKTTDADLRYTAVMDKTTPNKITATGEEGHAFLGPDDRLLPPYAGFTSIQSIPEIDTSGGIGLKYEEYIDGRARKLWLETSMGILNARFTVVGHEIYADTLGLGVDSIFVKWNKAKRDDDSDDIYWVTGNWLLYGFHHVITRGKWTTDLYCSRYDRKR